MSLTSDKKSSFFGKLFGFGEKKATLVEEKPEIKEVPPEKRPKLVKNPEGAVPNFQPDPLDLCYCGSGEFFKNCCGSKEENRNPPYGVFVFENYLSKNVVKELTDFLEKQPSEPLTVIDNDLSTPNNIVTKMDDQRKSERVEMGDYYQSISKIVQSTFIDLSEKCLNVKMDWCEPPQVLRYYPGGFYQGHADGENQSTQDQSWTKVIDRDLSMLIYLNEDFEGGNLLFDRFNYFVKPKAGTAVIFPSDNRYLHTAQEVKSGIRLAIVSWGAVHGIPKVAKLPPQDAILLNYQE